MFLVGVRYCQSCLIDSSKSSFAQVTPGWVLLLYLLALAMSRMAWTVVVKLSDTYLYVDSKLLTGAVWCDYGLVWF